MKVGRDQQGKTNTLERAMAIKCLCGHYVCPFCARQLMDVANIHIPFSITSRSPCQKCRPITIEYTIVYAILKTVV